MAEHKGSWTSPAPAMRVECFIICDYARVENGKLDVLGGGWNRIQPPRLPLPYQFFVAVKVLVPRELEDDSVAFWLEFVDEDGTSVDDSFANTRRITVGELAYVADEASFAEAFGINATIEMPGAYTIRLLGNGEPLAHVTFHVSEPPSPSLNATEVRPGEEARNAPLP